jgi:hypothetical protein
MMERVVNKHDLQTPEAAKDDLRYWLGKPHEERVAAVDAFRELFYGSTPRLQRITQVVQQASS